MIAYRRSWFEEAGAAKFPETWEEYRKVGKVLKAKNRPIGQTLGHTFGDAPTFAYPFLWSWGGKEVEADGKTVAINTKETVASVDFMTGLTTTWAASPGTPTTTAHSCHRRSAPRSAVPPSSRSATRSAHHGEGCGAAHRHPARTAAQGSRGSVLDAHLPQPRCRRTEEPEGRQGILGAHSRRVQWFISQGFATRARPSGRSTLWGEDPSPTRSYRLGRTPVYAGPSGAKAGEVLSVHRRYVREGRKACPPRMPSSGPRATKKVCGARRCRSAPTRLARGLLKCFRELLPEGGVAAATSILFDRTHGDRATTTMYGILHPRDAACSRTSAGSPLSSCCRHWSCWACSSPPAVRSISIRHELRVGVPATSSGSPATTRSGSLPPGLQHVPLYGRDDRVQAGAWPVAGIAAQPFTSSRPSPAPSSCCPSSRRSPPSRGSGCSTRLSVLNRLMFQLGAITGRINCWAIPTLPWPRLWSTLARRAVLRHQSAGRPADYKPSNEAAAIDGAAPAALLAHCGRSAAGDHGRGALLRDPDLRRLPDRL